MVKSGLCLSGTQSAARDAVPTCPLPAVEGRSGDGPLSDESLRLSQLPTVSTTMLDAAPINDNPSSDIMWGTVHS